MCRFSTVEAIPRLVNDRDNRTGLVVFAVADIPAIGGAGEFSRLGCTVWACFDDSIFETGLTS